MQFLKWSLLVFLLLFGYLFFWPTTVDPVAWEAPENKGYTAEFATNNRLNAVEVLHKTCDACEDVAVDSTGRVFGAAANGDIKVYEGEKETTLVNTGGRPLGLDFHPNGDLYIADAQKGLLVYHVKDESLEVLSTEHSGRPYKFTDDLEVGPDGKVYFSDASDRYGIADYKFDLLESCPAGRLLVFDPVSSKVELLLDQLHFANGIATSPDSNFVLVNETSRFRITKYWLRGDKAGIHEILIDNLPAFPDGISRGEDGIYWVALISPRQAVLDQTAGSPFLRKAIARLPDWLQPAPETYVGVVGINAAGQIIYNFQDPNGKFAQIASVQQVGPDLYFGSLLQSGVGILRDFRSK